MGDIFSFSSHFQILYTLRSYASQGVEKHGKLSECGYGSSDGANETKHGKLSIYSSRIYQKLFGKVLYLYFYLPWHEHKIGFKYDLADKKLVTDEN